MPRAEREFGAVGEHAGDVGEWAAEMRGDAGQRGVAVAAVVQQPQGDGVLGGLRDGGMSLIVLAGPAAMPRGLGIRVSVRGSGFWSR